jgi:flagellar protein FliO/FliZ
MADVSVFALLARLVISLAVVLGLMAFAARLLARQAKGGRLARRVTPIPIEVLARQSLGKNSSVAVVHAAGRALIVGVTDSQVTLLGEGDPELLQPPADTEDSATTITAAARTRSPWTAPGATGAAAFSPWTAMLDTLRERTVRKS